MVHRLAVASDHRSLGLSDLTISMRWPSFQRVRLFARRFLGARIAVIVTGLIAATLAPLLIIVLGLFVSLLADGGRLRTPIAQRETADALAGRAADRVDAEGAVYIDRGLLPIVWRNHRTLLGGPLVKAYRAWPALQTNGPCLLTLMGVGWLLAMLLTLVLWVLEVSIQSLAVSVISRISVAVQQQAVRLGSSDWLSSRRFGPTDLLTETSESLRRGLVAWWRVVPHSLALIASLLILMLVAQIWLAIAALVVCCLAALILTSMHRRARQRAKLAGDRASQHAPLLVESLRQARLMGGVNDADINATYATEVARLRKLAVAQHTAVAGIGPLVLFFGLSGAILILLLVGVNALQDPPQMTLAGTVVLLASLCWMGHPLLRCLRLLRCMPDCESASDELLTYLDRDPAVGQVAHAQPLNRLLRGVELDRVSLADALGRRLLDQVSLKFPAGSNVSIVASDSVTPAAIAGLIPRYYDPVAGRIQFDGADIRLATLESLRGQVCVLLPDNVLWTASVRDNIACGDDRFSLTQITDAAKAAQAYDFIESLPQGFNTIVGAHGTWLDPTQVVRVALARVLLHDPAVILLEEPAETSDPRAGELMDAAIAHVGKNRLVIILAGRVSTLRTSQRILLFHDGQLHAEGTHLDLLQTSDLYRHLNYVRFNDFRGTVQ